LGGRWGRAWRVEGEVRYLVTALGLLSKQNYLEVKGFDSFQREMYPTGKFPKECDFSGKRVGVVGYGSTGVQVITDIC
jgi:cyclohexanone monooxygenase